MPRIIEAEARITATDNTGGVFATIANKFKTFEQTVSRSGLGMTQWGGAFQKELDKLKLAPRDFDRIGQSWDQMIARLRAGGPPRFGVWVTEQEQWKNRTLEQLRQVSAGYERLEARQRRSGLGVGPLVGGYLGYRAGRGVVTGGEKVGEAEREKAREWLGGMSEDETAIAASKARELSTKYPSVGPVAIMEHIRLLRGRFGDMGHALENVEPLVQAQTVLQTMNGGKDSSADLEQLVLGLEGLGAGAHPEQFKKYLNSFVKARSLFPDLTGSKYLEYLQTSKASKYGLSEDYLVNVAPTMMQHETANKFGTMQATAFGSLVGLRMKPRSADAMFAYDLVGEWDLDSKGKKIITQIKGERDLISNPYTWARNTLAPALGAKGITIDKDREGFVSAVTKLFSDRNAAEFFTSLLVNSPVIEKDRAMLAKAKGLDAAEEIRARDPFVAFKGVTEQMYGFMQAVGGPLGGKAASVLNSIADAIARMSKGVGGDSDKAEGIAELAGLGAGGLGLLVARKAVRWLLDIGRGGGGAPAVGAGGAGWLGRMGVLGLPLALSGDTPKGDQPWLDKWKVPENWDYTRGARGGFNMRPGSTFGSGFEPPAIPLGIPGFEGFLPGFEAFPPELTGPSFSPTKVRPSAWSGSDMHGLLPGFEAFPPELTGPSFSPTKVPSAWLGSDMHGLLTGDFGAAGGAPVQAEVKGNADLGINVTISPSEDFLSRVETTVRNAINAFGSATVGTTGPTGRSMPEAGPAQQ